MFGQNVARGREHREDNKLQVHEVFYTIQGEGVFSGHAAVFIRLSGCNFRCWFCDTVWDDENDKYLTLEEIWWQIKEAKSDHCRLVVVTGGEPLRQDLSHLAKMLDDHGMTMQVETAGAYWQPCLMDHNVYTTISPKSQRVRPEYLKHSCHGGMNKKFTWKYVINADEVDTIDGLPSEPMQRMKNGSIGGGVPARPPEGAVVYLQPCDIPSDIAATKRNYKAVGEVALEFGHIAGVQVHKLIDVE